MPTQRVAVAVAALLLSVFAAAPAGAEAATQTMVASCAGVNLRTGPSTTNAVKTRISAGATVSVSGSVAGAAWSAICPDAKSGSTWYRITALNGSTVTSLYGITALFAATGVLQPASASSPGGGSATPDAYGSELMRLVNLERAALGKPALPVDPGLVAIARDAPFACPTNPALVLNGRAADMAARSYFGHYVLDCLVAGTTTPYLALEIVRTVFGYTEARSEILHWNMVGSGPTTYQLGCDINGANCTGGTTLTPKTVAVAQQNFMGSSVHRASQLGTSTRFGCGSASVPGTTRTYFACLFSNGASTVEPTPTPTPEPSPTPEPTPTPTPDPTPTHTPPPAPAPATQAMVASCAGVNLRTGPSTTNAVKTRLSTGATVTVSGSVAGAAWSAICPDAKSGDTWYRITALNGSTVKSLYGITALFAATGVLQPAPASSPGGGSAAGPTELGASVTFFGRGWGHGVGLSQHGARGRALAGQSAAEILAHYFAGTTIGTVPAGALIRVLLLERYVPATATPLTVFGRGDAWTIAGAEPIFPADARLSLLPPTADRTTAWRAVVDDAAGTVLYDAAAPADIRLAGATTATIFELPARSTTYGLYRGTLRILLAGATADVVNELPLEEYLRGVVPVEMPSTWPVAARTAQTIAARSRAAAHLRPGVSIFDAYDDTRSQVYRGVRAETAAADALIAETANQVLLSGTAVAGAMFHSTGGGATENNENVYVSATGARVAVPVPYLRGSPDRDANGVPYDAAAPYATWQTAAYPLAQLSAIFAADPRTAVGSLVALDLRNRGISGRLISVTLIGSGGSRTVSGSIFVAVFNAHRPTGDPLARSTLLDLAPIP